jgi:hypothetical protein
MEKYKTKLKRINIEKAKTNEYLDEKKNKYNNLFFINETEKLDKQDIQIENSSNEKNEEIKFKVNINIPNNKVISDLVKSFKIKTMIENKKQKNFHFPLEGILTKKYYHKKYKFIRKDKE